nr:hypothetical protein [Endozoicomonas sp.]
AELQAELQAELEKEFMEDDDNNLKALTPKSLEEAQIQERAALDERVNSLQTFSNESAKTILEENRRTTLKSDRLYKGKELPTNTGTQIFSLIKEEDNDNNDNVVMLYRAGSEASGSESTQNLEKQSTTHPLQPRKIGNENSKPAISPQKNEQLPESGANYVQTTIQPFALSIKSLLDEHSQNHKSLAGITDTDIMNIIYHASFEHKEGSLKGVDFNILLEINEATWLINRGDIRTLHIPHQNPKVRYLQAVNTDPDVAERLAKVIFEKDEIKPWQLKMAKELPAVTKLPTAEDGAYYLLQTGTALSEFIPDIERIVEGKVKGKQESQREEIIEAITTELSKKQSGQTGITDLQVIGYCFPTAQT